MGDLLVFIKVVCLIVTIMIVWFKSSAFVEYAKLFGLRNLLLNYNDGSEGLTFPQHLYIKSKLVLKCSICKFLVALITCPLCIAFWLCIIASCVFTHWTLIPVLYLTVLITYFLIERVIG